MSTMRDLQRGFRNCHELLFFFIVIQISAILRYIRIKRHSKITSFIYKKTQCYKHIKLRVILKWINAENCDDKISYENNFGGEQFSVKIFCNRVGNYDSLRIPGVEEKSLLTRDTISILQRVKYSIFVRY